MNGPANRSDIVIVGGVAAGPKVAASLLRRKPDLTVTVFQRERHISYGTCGLPYFASGDINSFDELTKTSYGLERSPDFFRRTKGFDIFPNAEVTAVDRRRKTVTVRIRDDSGATVEHAYGTLVLATGATPNEPPFPAPESPRVRPFTRPDDAVAFRRLAEQGKIAKVVIIGGGFIGCELTEAVAGLWGIEAVIVEKEPQLLPYALDPEMAAIVGRELKRRDVTVITGATVEKIELDGKGDPVTQILGHDPVTADCVFLCLGVHPEVTLARDCGLEIGRSGGIVVDSHLRTSDPAIYAAGDCIESVHRITGAKMYVPMGSLANRHGRVIAENIAGFDAEFSGALGTFVVKVFDLNVGSVGLSAAAAAGAGIETASVWGSFPDKPDYYPDARMMTLKMVYEPGSGRLLGLQAVGTGDICRRVDVMSALVQSGATVADALAFEHGYAPPYAEALDPIHHLAAMAQAQQRGNISLVAPDIDPSAYDDDTVWLDVREPAEIEAEPWPHDADGGYGRLVAIPLNELRERLDDLDKNCNIVVICKRGPRAYQALVILRQAGFANVAFVGGGFQASHGFV